MKRILLGLFTITAIGTSTAQTNLDLEAWTSGGAYEDPDGWFTPNQFSAQGVPVTVTKETANPGGGLYSAVMTTTQCQICLFAGITDTLPGVIQQAIPFTETSVGSIDFSYLYNAVSGDEGLAMVRLTKWNTITNSADEVGIAAINLAVIVLRYTEPVLERPFRVPINVGKFPILPLFGFGTTIYMMLQFEIEVVLVGVAIIGIGSILYVILKKQNNFSNSN